ncbi:nucleoside/nucleotide kinase family protein [Pseudarthrobacter sp. NPDC058362]|uniref:nucleoside/nucleotide kinase family protein n=1 Tax=Pseudarthrobacter sp. NPDC058362 TaxID=3346458 RepID=UPI003654A72D
MDSPEVTEAVDALRGRLADGRRVILGIAGAPGSGKSTFAAWLQQQFPPGSAVVVPMDGFHLANSVIDGTPLRQRKGAMDTFDAGGYLALLRRLVSRDEDVVYAPEFRRTIDEPVAAAIAVPAAVPLVITEGNYLLAEQDPWKDVRAQLEETWFIDTPQDLRMSRLIARHIGFGMEPESARAWATGPDEANARIILATKAGADRIIPRL